MACLDTSAVIDLISTGVRQRRLALMSTLKRLVDGGETLTTTRLTMAELWTGVERSPHRNREAKKVLDALGQLGMLEFDEVAAKLYGRIQAILYEAGTPIGDMDALIAAIALRNGEPIVTRNAKHFARVPGLQVETYG